MSVSHPLAALDLRLGALSVYALSDGVIDVPSAYFSAPPPTDTTRLGANVWLVRGGGKLRLIDAGSGTALHARFPETGRLSARLRALGIGAEEITDVIVTHMHADHIGGLTEDLGAGRTPVFANAEIHLSAVEWGFWTDPALLAGADEATRPMIEMIQSLSTPLGDRIRLHEGPADLGGGLNLEPAPGHTPGHLAIRIADGPDQCLILADAAIAEPQLAAPDVRYALEVDPAQAAATRRRLLDAAATDGVPVAATHLAFPGVGRVERVGEGYRISPLD